jgi:hypothetical protein
MRSVVACDWLVGFTTVRDQPDPSVVGALATISSSVLLVDPPPARTRLPAAHAVANVDWVPFVTVRAEVASAH